MSAWYAGDRFTREEASLNPAEDLHSGLIALPVVAWASRFRSGQTTLRGQAKSAEIEVEGLQFALLEGEVRVALSFTAGPRLTSLRIEGALAVAGEAVAQITLEGGELVVDGRRGPSAAPLDRVLEALVAHLHDVEVVARALPDGELLVRFGNGLEVSIPGSATLTVQGATVGEPHALRLSSPLVVSVDGAQLRLTSRQLRWLGSLARIRVHRATLHPDGSVHIEGGGRVGLNGAIRSGLHQASERLSDLVRYSPRFARVRAFLRPVAR